MPCLKVDGLLFHVTRGPDHSSIIWLFYRNANLSIEVSLNAQVCKKIVTGVNSKCCCLSYIERPLVSGQDWTWMLIKTGQSIRILFWGAVDFLNMNTISLCLHNCFPSKNMTPHSKDFTSNCSLQVSTL